MVGVVVLVVLFLPQARKVSVRVDVHDKYRRGVKMASPIPPMPPCLNLTDVRKRPIPALPGLAKMMHSFVVRNIRGAAFKGGIDHHRR
jgi:hypothetical protein